MTWNYRVIRHVEKSGEWLAIHEVYYDESGKPDGVTQDPSLPIGDNWEEFQADLNSYNMAMLQPVLEYEMFLEQERQAPVAPK